MGWEILFQTRDEVEAWPVVLAKRLEITEDEVRAMLDEIHIAFVIVVAAASTFLPGRAPYQLPHQSPGGRFDTDASFSELAYSFERVSGCWDSTFLLYCRD